MKNKIRTVLGPWLAAAALLTPGATAAQEPVPPPRPQNPSPMVERTRAHERVPQQELPGTRVSIDAGLPRPVQLFIPEGVEPGPDTSLLLHFHGAAFVAEHAAAAADRPYVLAVINAGAGTSAYERPFTDPAVFDTLLARLRTGIAASHAAGPVPDSASDAEPAFGRIVVSAFSAGHGAVRALLRTPRHREAIDAALLLDGIHTGYIPEATPVHEGGVLDAGNLEPWLPLATAAIHGERTVLLTHSEIFPGTFASTTETADYLLEALGLARTPVLAWGPVGMQQLSEASAGRFLLMGFAGNSAPDHVDHFHGMGEFLRALDAAGRPRRGVLPQ
jgi:hypothetical protein